MSPRRNARAAAPRAPVYRPATRGRTRALGQHFLRDRSVVDRIVDLVSSGKTLRAHNLVVTDVITESTARLIVNRASLKLKHKRVNGLIEALRTGLQRGRP